MSTLGLDDGHPNTPRYMITLSMRLFILTRDEGLRKQCLDPIRSQVDGPGDIHSILCCLHPLLTAIKYQLLAVFRCQCDQNGPEEGTLGFRIAAPVIRHMCTEIMELDRLGPYSRDCQFPPYRYSQLPDLILVEEALAVAEDLLHEVEAARLLPWEIDYIM